MKYLLSLSMGMLIGLSSLFFHSQIKSFLQRINILPLSSEKIHHHAEGKKLQEIEFIEEDDYKSAEGNQAMLYQLHNQCKLIIQINGETVFTYQTIYFHKGKILNIIESTYRSSWGEAPNYNEENPKALFTTTTFNPQSPLTQETINLIQKYVSKTNMKKC